MLLDWSLIPTLLESLAFSFFLLVLVFHQTLPAEMTTEMAKDKDFAHNYATKHPEEYGGLGSFSGQYFTKNPEDYRDPDDTYAPCYTSLNPELYGGGKVSVDDLPSKRRPFTHERTCILALAARLLPVA